MAISIVHMTTYNGSVGGGPAAVTIPATTAGNTLVLLEADYGQGGGNIGFQPTLGAVNLVQSPADVAFLASGANIWYLTNIAAGQTSVSWAAVSPGAAVIYELTPCTYDQSANDMGGNGASASEVATAISGAGTDAYFVVIGQGRPSSTPAGSYNSVNAPWTLDLSQSGLFFGFLGVTDHGMGGFAHILNTTGAQQATFALSNFQIIYGSSAISFTDAAPPTTGNIVIRKTTVPGGSPQAFTFTPSYGAPFNLTDGQTNDSDALAPGSYSVVETPVAGWDTTVNGNPANILVVAGQTTTVTFTNTKRLCQLAVSPASLSFVKDQCGTVPLPKSFTLTNIGNADVIPFTVSADQPWVILNPTVGNTPATVQVSVNLLGLAPGTYTATISFLSSCGNPVVPTVLIVLVVGQTVVAACIPDPNADAENVPSLNGVFTSLVSSGQVVNPSGFPPGTYNFQSFTQAGPDVTAFGGELFSTLCGRQRIIMVVPDQYDDDGVGIDCQYLPWLAQMPPNVLGHGGFRAQLQGNGVIRMTPLNEKNDNRYKPLEVLLAPGPPISFEKGVRATEKYLGILFSNKKICGAFFVIQELVQYANPKYGGSRSPKT